MAVDITKLEVLIKKLLDNSQSYKRLKTKLKRLLINTKV